MIATQRVLKAAAMAASSKQPLVVATTLRTTRAAAAAAANTSRAAGSKYRFLTTKTPQKPPTPAPPSNKAAPSKSTKPSSASYDESTAVFVDMANPPDVQLEVTPQMKMANVGLAVILCGFVGGIWYYSMNAVGSQGKSGDDPLAQLKLEAQEAMDRQEKDNTPDERAQQLLQEFNKGVHDPDKAELDALEELEQMEAEDAQKKKKKAWWKFW